MISKNLFPLLLFLCITFVLARCASSQRASEVVKKGERTEKRQENTADLSENRLRNEVVEFAEKYVGTGYKYAGKNPQGFDCSGFVCYVMGEHGVSVAGSSRAQESNGFPVNPYKSKPGDLIFFRRAKHSDVFHVGIVYSNDRDGLRVIHSTSSRGVVLDNISDNSYWMPKISTGRDVLSQ